MLEMDEQRYKAAIESIVQDTPMSAPSRVDIISTVHGGLMTRELKSAVEAAREMDASIYLVDRPYRITQNRLAEKVLNPYVFANLFVYGKMSLMNRVNNSTIDLEKFLKTEATPIYKVLIEERAQYMAKLIDDQARDNETIVIVCSPMHVEIIKSLLSSPAERISRLIDIGEISRKGLPLWPILVGIYFVLPVSLGFYFWMMLLSGILGGLKRMLLPQTL
jgi:pheromone shutdown protein TraB